jgi:hypothetical protein
MEFPSNSHQAKATEPQPDPVKKIDKVVTNDVTRRKKPLGKRFAETFVGGDARSVSHYVLFEVLVPAAKDTISDAVSQGVERLIFGESRSGSRRSGGYRSSGAGSFVSYNKMSQRNADPRREREDVRGLSRRARASHDFDEIILATRAEAEEVIERLYDIVRTYEVATVGDLMELVGATPNYTDNKWGWTDMTGARAERTRGGGYVLDLPKTEAVD